MAPLTAEEQRLVVQALYDLGLRDVRVNPDSREFTARLPDVTTRHGS